LLFNRTYINQFFLAALVLVFLNSLEGYSQIVINGKKTIPITDGPRLNISKRKKVKIFKRSNKLKTKGSSTVPNLKGQSRFKGSIRLNKIKRRKNKAALFRGNIKDRSSGSSYDIARNYKGNFKVRKGKTNRRTIKRYSGNFLVQNKRRKSLNKLRPIYVKVAPKNKRGNAIKKYSGNIKLRRPGSFRHAGSNYRGDIRIKKSRMASRRRARYHGGPVNPLERAKYRNQLIKNSRRKDGQYGKRPKKRNRKKVKLKYDTREGRIWQDH